METATLIFSVIIGGALVILNLMNLGLLYQIINLQKQSNLDFADDLTRLNENLVIYNNNFMLYYKDMFEKPIKFDTDFYRDNI
jgi:hypothetical protein